MDVEEAYPVIERIIVNGFLTVELRIDGSYLVMKNLTDKESSMLDMFRDRNNVLSDFTCKLAFCTFSIDGESLLDRRSEAVPALMEMYSSAPVSLVSSVKESVLGLSGKYFDVLEYLEGYCYTDRSRYLWKIYKEDGLFSLPGSRLSGLNAVQENWAIINRQLDEEEDYHKQFHLFLMVASSMNAKGSKMIARNYDTQRNELKDLRVEITKWGYDKKRVEQEKKNAEWTTPLRNREDIVRELYRQMRGEKDKHDLFIDKWMVQQRDRAEAAKKQAAERAAAFREGLNVPDQNLDAEESRSVTSEEIEALSKAPKNYTPGYMSSYAHLEKDDRFIKKISSRVIR
jgi:hypothetical protein